VGQKESLMKVKTAITAGILTIILGTVLGVYYQYSHGKIILFLSIIVLIIGLVCFLSLLFPQRKGSEKL
jgi:vacuolar-type H+-ATPase subunit I/STV1